MDNFTACEMAYKNGFKDGVNSIKKTFETSQVGQMRYEIFTAICEYYNSEPEILASCLNYLFNIPDARMQVYVDRWFRQNNYCRKCGEKLEVTYTKDYYDAGDFVDVVYTEEKYCPNCDISFD